MAGRPLVFVEHGAGQTYDGDPAAADNPCYPGGTGLERVVLFLAPNQDVAQRWRARYPQAPAVVVGCPKLDAWHSGAAAGAVTPLRKAEPERTAAPGHGPGVAVVALSFHWDCHLIPETTSAWPHWDPALAPLVAAAARSGWELWGHGHPRLWGRIERRWRALGVRLVPELADVLDHASLLVIDNSSAAYEFASLDRPVLSLNAPWYRRHVEHGLRFWSHVPGLALDDPRDLVDGIELALSDPPMAKALRARASERVYAQRDGHAAQRAVAALAELTKDWSEQMPDPYAPSGRTRRGSERQSPLVSFTSRLSALGATDDELEAVRAHWDDPEWPNDERDELVRMTDRQLLTMIDDSRREYDIGTITEEDEAHRRELQVARDEAITNDVVLYGPAPQVLGWVAGNPLRALAVKEIETAPRGKHRKLLLGQLNEIIDAAGA